MKVLLDTHVFLWSVTDDRRLSWRAREIITAPEAQLVVSTASAWEMATKAARGRLKLHRPIGQILTEHERERLITILPITLGHALRSAELPDIHRDPFDRLLVAQALVEGMPILTRDVAVRRYEAETIW